MGDARHRRGGAVNRPPTAEERANKAIRESLTMARDDAAYHLRQVGDILCAEGEHAAQARCCEEIRRRAVPAGAGGPL